MSRYELSEELKETYTPIIKQFISHAEQNEFPDNLLELTISDLNPYTLMRILEELGYRKEDIDTNGWEMDFWISMKKDGFNDISIRGTGITFELNLYIGE